MHLPCGSLYYSLSHNVRMHLSGPFYRSSKSWEILASSVMDAELKKRKRFHIYSWYRDHRNRARQHHLLVWSSGSLPAIWLPVEPLTSSIVPPYMAVQYWRCVTTDTLIRTTNHSTFEETHSYGLSHIILNSRLIWLATSCIWRGILKLRGHELRLEPVRETGLQYFHVLCIHLHAVDFQKIFWHTEFPKNSWDLRPDSFLIQYVGKCG